MNPSQEQFYHFILERVQDGKQTEAESLLKESFGKQADGTMNAEFLASFFPRMTAILKPEYQEEVKNVMNRFRGEQSK